MTNMEKRAPVTKAAQTKKIRKTKPRHHSQTNRNVSNIDKQPIKNKKAATCNNNDIILAVNLSRYCY